MKLEIALPIADRVREILSPFCDRCEIAGSVRRKRPEVGDIEIVCIPKKEIVAAGDQGNFFGDDMVERPVHGFVGAVNAWQRVKGDPATGRYTQRILPEWGQGFTLDLFIVRPENWGNLFAVRTGSADYSRYVLAGGWVRAGYSSQDGMLTKFGVALECREEKDLFALIGIPFCEPEKREMPASHAASGPDK